MAARVVDADIEAIWTGGTVSDWSPYIAAAHIVVESKGIASADCHDEESLKEVERWLTAHFASSESEDTQSASLLGESVTFRGQGGADLNASKYGQRAKLLDCSGILNEIQEGDVAEPSIIGISNANRDLLS